MFSFNLLNCCHFLHLFDPITGFFFLLEEVDEDTLALYGMTLDQLGQFCLKQGRLTEAEVAFRQAATVARQIHGDQGDQTLVVLNSLASVLSLLGDSAGSLAILTHVVDQAQQSDSPHLTTFLVNRGIVQLRHGLDGRADCQRAKELAGRRGEKEASLEAEECLAGHLVTKGREEERRTTGGRPV